MMQGSQVESLSPRSPYLALVVLRDLLVLRWLVVDLSNFASAMTRPAHNPIVIMRWRLRVGTGEFVSDTHSLDIEREITPKQYLSQLFQVMHLSST
jgi:hypothetical protein